jgi:tRNA pseudouridine38-40 synthase
VKNLKFIIEYDGTDFHGWQIQPEVRTVQGDIEKGLHQLLQEPVRITGAGRTDQGVHALGQVAHCSVLSSMNIDQIRCGLNGLTSAQIYIKSIEEVSAGFHSRFSAKSKIYEYHIIREPFPCQLRYNWFVGHDLSLPDMRAATGCFIGQKDFKHFSVHNGKENTVCTIFDISLTESDSQLIIHIEGDRFLRKMVRGIAGFLYDIGRGRFSADDGPRALAGAIKDLFFAPPQGLFLIEVKY